MTQITVEHLNEALSMATPQADGKYSIDDVFNAAQKLAEQSQEQYITADEARKLAAGNAEYCFQRRPNSGWTSWARTTEATLFFDTADFKYRAIKQPEQVDRYAGLTETKEESDASWAAVDAPIEPHAELKAMYEQQVKDGTINDFVWEVDRKDNGVSYRKLDTPQERPARSEGYKYRCTPEQLAKLRKEWESKYPKAALSIRDDGQYSDELLEENWQGYLRAKQETATKDANNSAERLATIRNLENNPYERI